MPYNISKDSGGDTKENDSWMETCVMKVMKTGKDKSSAIAICKSTLEKKKGNKTEASAMIDTFNKLIDK